MKTRPADECLLSNDRHRVQTKPSAHLIMPAKDCYQIQSKSTGFTLD